MYNLQHKQQCGDLLNVFAVEDKVTVLHQQTCWPEIFCNAEDDKLVYYVYFCFWGHNMYAT